MLLDISCNSNPPLVLSLAKTIISVAVWIVPLVILTISIIKLIKSFNKKNVLLFLKKLLLAVAIFISLIVLNYIVEVAIENSTESVENLNC